MVIGHLMPNAAYVFPVVMSFDEEKSKSSARRKSKVGEENKLQKKEGENKEAEDKSDNKDKRNTAETDNEDKKKNEEPTEQKDNAKEKRKEVVQNELSDDINEKEKLKDKDEDKEPKNKEKNKEVVEKKSQKLVEEKEQSRSKEKTKDKEKVGDNPVFEEKNEGKENDQENHPKKKRTKSVIQEESSQKNKELKPVKDEESSLKKKEAKRSEIEEKSESKTVKDSEKMKSKQKTDGRTISDTDSNVTVQSRSKDDKKKGSKKTRDKDSEREDCPKKEKDKNQSCTKQRTDADEDSDEDDCEDEEKSRKMDNGECSRQNCGRDDIENRDCRRDDRCRSEDRKKQPRCNDWCEDYGDCRAKQRDDCNNPCRGENWRLEEVRCERHPYRDCADVKCPERETRNKSCRRGCDDKKTFCLITRRNSCDYVKHRGKNHCREERGKCRRDPCWDFEDRKPEQLIRCYANVRCDRKDCFKGEEERRLCRRGGEESRCPYRDTVSYRCEDKNEQYRKCDHRYQCREERQTCTSASTSTGRRECNTACGNRSYRMNCPEEISKRCDYQEKCKARGAWGADCPDQYYGRIQDPPTKADIIQIRDDLVRIQRELEKLRECLRVAKAMAERNKCTMKKVKEHLQCCLPCSIPDFSRILEKLRNCHLLRLRLCEEKEQMSNKGWRKDFEYLLCELSEIHCELENMKRDRK